MALQIQPPIPRLQCRPITLLPEICFLAIATDIHFWIPLLVLAGGFLLLDKLS